jgi:hypothetical protein
MNLRLSPFGVESLQCCVPSVLCPFRVESLRGSVADQDPFDTDPDPAFQFVRDPTV